MAPQIFAGIPRCSSDSRGLTPASPCPDLLPQSFKLSKVYWTHAGHRAWGDPGDSGPWEQPEPIDKRSLWPGSDTGLSRPARPRAAHTHGPMANISPRKRQARPCSGQLATSEDRGVLGKCSRATPLGACGVARVVLGLRGLLRPPGEICRWGNSSGAVAVQPPGRKCELEANAPFGL